MKAATLKELSIECLHIGEGEYVVTAAEEEALIQRVEKVLVNINTPGKVIHVDHGPSVNRYTINLDGKVKLNKIKAADEDIAFRLGVNAVRIQAPIPYTSYIAIEVPHKKRLTVTLRDVLESGEMKQPSLVLPLGKDPLGNAITCNLNEQGHLLIGGNVGTGKTTLLHSFIVSSLFASSKIPVKLCLIDPNVFDFHAYNKIPHLHCPVISDYQQALKTLEELLDEMMNRFDLLSKSNSKNIEEYNHKIRDYDDKMPYYLIVISELSDLMIMSKNITEKLICRIAQLGKNVGIHLVICSDRNSIDIFSPLIKANIPARICFNSSLRSTSRTLLGTTEAENLLDKGDMLYWGKSMDAAIRVQGCLITDVEIEQVIEEVKSINCPGNDNQSEEETDQLE